MKNERYKVIIQYYASEAQEVMLLEKGIAFEVYHESEVDSRVAWAALFDPNGKQIFDY
tara:strand:+ start:369 stop:542 length:174 start_codon:yes stop_codon:yes gene_type:complete